jgi:sugar lactone lactonase YvrE
MSGRNLRLASWFVAVVAFLASVAGCSIWVLGVVQGFGTPNGAKISTVAGSGTVGSSGDNGPATSAKLHYPEGVAVDSSGNIYFADTDNQVIREVDTSGTITRVAGIVGSSGYNADSIPATTAKLNYPDGVTVDVSGNLYIADSYNHCIRMVSGGTITTVAGTHGSPGYFGDGGSATSAQLYYPEGVAVDSSGNIYIADTDNQVIRKVDHTSHNISTVAGNGTAGYIGDGAAATSAELRYPNGVAVDASGNIYIADGGNIVVRKVDATSQTIMTVAGNGSSGDTGDSGPASAAEINYPNGVAVDSAGNLYLSTGNNVVRKVDASGNISTVAGNTYMGGGFAGDGNVSTAAMLYNPWGLAFDSHGNLYIVDNWNQRIRKVGFGG